MNKSNAYIGQDISSNAPEYLSRMRHKGICYCDSNRGATDSDNVMENAVKPSNNGPLGNGLGDHDSCAQVSFKQLWKSTNSIFMRKLSLNLSFIDTND